MARAATRFGVGTRLIYDGEAVEIIEIIATSAGNEVVLRSESADRAVRRVAVRELLTSDAVRVIPAEVGPAATDQDASASVILATLSEAERRRLLDRADHVREVLTGFKSGSAELGTANEPRPEYDPALPLASRYAAKAAEMKVGVRTLERWAGDYRKIGEAGLLENKPKGRNAFSSNDSRWVEIAREVMAEHTDQSRPSRTMVIERTNARVIARFGPDVVKPPSRATAFRVLEELERQNPLFRLSTKRNRDIADRPGGVYGKLRPTRPGEYLLMDTTRLDVFALDPVTLRWMQAELTVAMDWYTRCICGVRITPVSTKSVDAAATLYQSFRPRAAGKDWPRYAVWPEHGIPRSVLVDVDAVDGPLTGAANPAVVPETIVIDHGKIYISEHLTSVCQRMGISIQPARLRTGRDKGPVERFFRTLREDLLQALPGYKGPDVHSRGLDPESEAFFYLDELEAIIREWIAVVYHHRPHDSLVDPHALTLRMSPATMFEHGMARAGYIEVPRDPDLAYEFLKVEWRSIQHYGIELGGRRYNGPVLDGLRGETSHYTGKAKGRWPIHYDPDDITRTYFRHSESNEWHPLRWEHAPAADMPFSEEALTFARRLAASKYTYPDDRLAVADLLERWNLGLGSSVVERRMALRLSREATFIDNAAEDSVNTLPSVAKVLEITADSVEPGPTTSEPEPQQDDREVGDDDLDDEFGDETEDFDEDDFYADALEDV
ncbi:DDE-type integrase/transposase/recombinase [Nocardia brasiliensis]|uniref:DDE-type integrase/transposase/recombinase n=1 Tax=Nocardia brasiliensis TaxID=37326 RepID=A0A6G9Y1F3_NOCBR|nr:Mu transposase C-terminal domain-containing protein [Nocardia brasiliensis]QIS06946.1 DDE-type integrase/transposase/recombinase [Nocardia brasiliensis]